jgi:hypothetical protein
MFNTSSLQGPPLELEHMKEPTGRVGAEALPERDRNRIGLHRIILSDPDDDDAIVRPASQLVVTLSDVPAKSA